jgi:hypothetical protein
LHKVNVGITVAFARPDLPVYEQPICPEEGYIWTPGFWAYDPDFGDYYWVPGTWVLAPKSVASGLQGIGLGAAGDSSFMKLLVLSRWASMVGINYGYGYFGHGYEGGRWEGDRFLYNRAVNNVNVTIIHNVYEVPVNVRNAPRVSSLSPPQPSPLVE